MDEDFAGAIAEVAMRMGGANTHQANIQNLMGKYRALLHLGEDLNAMAENMMHTMIDADMICVAVLFWAQSLQTTKPKLTPPPPTTPTTNNQHPTHDN